MLAKWIDQVADVPRTLADYTIGTLIVMVHMATVGRRPTRDALPARP